MTDALRDAIAKALPCKETICGQNYAMAPRQDGKTWHSLNCPVYYRDAVADAIDPVIRSEVEAAVTAAEESCWEEIGSWFSAPVEERAKRAIKIRGALARRISEERKKAFEEAAVALENSYSIGENTQQGCIAIVRQLGVSGK